MQNSILIIAELQDRAVHPVCYELIGKAREMVKEQEIPVNCLVLGPEELPL